MFFLSKFKPGCVLGYCVLFTRHLINQKFLDFSGITPEMDRHQRFCNFRDPQKIPTNFYKKKLYR